MKPITYCLNPSATNNFYEVLSSFTDVLLLDAQSILSKEIVQFIAFVDKAKSTPTRKKEEYLVEFLLLGVFSRRYWGYAKQSSAVSIHLHKFLYDLRKKNAYLKPTIDSIRGYTSKWWLYNAANKTEQAQVNNINRLIDWLQASGEFTEEAKRLRVWQRWLQSLSPQQATDCLQLTINFSTHFEKIARQELAAYTCNVSAFLANYEDEYRGREDFLFCGRSELEYHLNMFGAEILNRVMRADFDACKQKVLLLPTCMCAPEHTCKAKSEGLHLVCVACSADCGVKRLQDQMKNNAVIVRLIPHSSGFSKFLQQWQNQNHTGLIGVACILNLLTGGYEMQRLGIPSQCVFLDTCGCKKHWHPKGVVTSLDASQLQLIVSEPASVACCS